MLFTLSCHAWNFITDGLILCSYMNTYTCIHVFMMPCCIWCSLYCCTCISFGGYFISVLIWSSSFIKLHCIVHVWTCLVTALAHCCFVCCDWMHLNTLHSTAWFMWCLHFELLLSTLLAMLTMLLFQFVHVCMCVHTCISYVVLMSSLLLVALPCWSLHIF